MRVKAQNVAEEVLGSGSALWFSPDGARFAYAKFNDSLVEDVTFLHYGLPGALEGQYPTPVQIRYPKAGSRNPEVALFVADVATSTSTELPPPTDEVSR